jgi:hypothetical protein
MRTLLVLVAVVAGAVASAPGAEKQTICRMEYTLEGWSAIYQRAEGRGTVTCDNGQRARVSLSGEGAGLAAGKFQVDDGRGRFSSVHDISEIFGTYARANADAGAVDGVAASALTKGQVSLSLAGTGKGFDVGVAFGKFEVNRAGKK